MPTLKKPEIFTKPKQEEAQSEFSRWLQQEEIDMDIDLKDKKVRVALLIGGFIILATLLYFGIDAGDTIGFNN